jgi:serine/threonine-protein kinase RsbW
MSTSDQRGQSGPLALRLHLDCHFGAVRRGASQVREFLLERGLPERDVWACELAFVEGCNNAVQNTPPANAEKQLFVELTCHNTHVELRINDHTDGYELPEEARLPSAEEESGRGIFLMRSLMDQVDYVRSSSSNCLVLKKALTGI